MFWSAKNSVAIFLCQYLLLGTNVPKDSACAYKFTLKGMDHACQTDYLPVSIY